MQTEANVSVIIPTMASPERAMSIKRAVESVRNSSRIRVEIIAVVNGARYDREICDWLKAQPDIRFEYVEKPSLPSAILRGRELVTSQYFCTVDDDDEYLEAAIDNRLRAMVQNPAADVVVTNGFRHLQGSDTVFYSNLDQAEKDPLACLMQFNWLHNCNALYRTESIDLDYFKDGHPYAEWTWLAFRLAMDNKKIVVLNEPTFRYNDTPASLSKSDGYLMAYPALFERMLRSAPPKTVARMIGRKLGAALHDISAAAMKRGNRQDAVKYHFRSLLRPGGLRYLSYSRHLL